jgi:hypothetical protein
MTAEIWRGFITSPHHAGRHLAPINSSAELSTSPAIDAASLEIFLQRLRATGAGASFLGSVVDLLDPGYEWFARSGAARLLDELPRDSRHTVTEVGPILRGSPRWDLTILRRRTRSLPTTRFISRVIESDRSSESRRAVKWLVTSLLQSIGEIGAVIGSASVPSRLLQLAAILRNVPFADGPYVGGQYAPSGLDVLALSRSKHPFARRAAVLVNRRLSIREGAGRRRWQALLALLAVSHVSPDDEDDLFELFVLVLVLDVLETELGLPAPIEAGLVVPGRTYVARYQCGWGELRVYFDQAGPLRGGESSYLKIVNGHSGLTGAHRRPDIVLEMVPQAGTMRRFLLIEAKRSHSPEYLSDSVYKLLGYIRDFEEVQNGQQRPLALLVVPPSIGHVPADRQMLEVEVVGAANRARLAACLGDALGLG